MGSWAQGAIKARGVLSSILSPLLRRGERKNEEMPDRTGSDHDKLLKAEQLTRVGPSFLAASDFRFVHALAHAKGQYRLRREMVMTAEWVGHGLKMGSRHTVANSLKVK